MTNAIKGEVAFECDGKKYVFVLGFLAMQWLENKSGKPVAELFGNPEKATASVTSIVDVFRAGMMRHHGQMTEGELTDLMDDLGMPKINEILTEAVKLMAQRTGGQGTENPIPIGKGANNGSAVSTSIG